MQDYFLIDGTLYHHGIMGQKWGRRRFQNEDGSLTEEGRRRYGVIGKDKKVKIRDIRKERSNLITKYENEDPRNKEISKLYNKIGKNTKDLDVRMFIDGNDFKKEYERRSINERNKINKLEDQIATDALNRAKKEITEKYGTMRVNQLKAADGAIMVATGAAIVGAITAYAINDAEYRYYSDQYNRVIDQIIR